MLKNQGKNFQHGIFALFYIAFARLVRNKYGQENKLG